MAALTIACLGGWTNDLIYGWRNLYCSGILEGSIDKRVVNIGRVWYGKKVVTRKAVLYS